MTPDAVFSVANSIALLSWIALAIAPNRRFLADVLIGRVIPAAFAGLYTTILAFTWAGSSGGFSSLADVAALFANRWLLLAGWIHYLAFDLFVGSWEVQDARARGVPRLAVLPCLALTFLFGPAGLLAYFGVRAAAAPRA